MSIEIFASSWKHFRGRVWFNSLNHTPCTRGVEFRNGIVASKLKLWYEATTSIRRYVMPKLTKRKRNKAVLGAKAVPAAVCANELLVLCIPIRAKVRASINGRGSFNYDNCFVGKYFVDRL